VRSIAPKLKDKASLGNYKEDIIISVYGHLGCYKDTPYWWDSLKRSIPSIEGKYPKVTGDYRTRKDPIGKCADTAKELGYKVFALQNGGQCFTSEDAEKSYSKYGLSDKCRDGIGGPLVSDVYTL